jgi:DNA-binding transcriptional ArsR family regulator
MKEISDEMIHKVVQRLTALADASRIRLLMRIRDGDCTIGALASDIGLSQPSVSKHVAVLKAAGLVVTRRNGTQVLCGVADPAIYDLCSVVCDGVVRHLRKEHEAIQGTLSSMAPVAKGKDAKRSAKGGATDSN